MLQKIDNSYQGFTVTVYDTFKEKYPILFRYNYFHKFLIELQNILNIYFLIPFFKHKFWDYLTYNELFIAKFIFALFTAMPYHIGNGLYFKNNDNVQITYKSFLSLSNYRTALRVLYIKNNVKIWIFNTHLSAPGESENKNGCNVCHDQCLEILPWIDDTQNEIEAGDVIIVCGDFNIEPNSSVYKLMTEDNGFKSVMNEKYGDEMMTLPTDTFSFDYNAEKRDKTFDYIFYKTGGDRDVKIDIIDAEIVATEYVKHTDDASRSFFASDHMAISCKLTISIDS